MGNYLHLVSGLFPWIDIGQWCDLLIAALTCAGAAVLTVTMLHWTKRLRYSRTSLRPLIFSLALAKFALFFWTGSNVLNIMVGDASLPSATLPARLLWLVVVVIQVWVVTRIRPAPMLPDSLESELDRDGRLVLLVEDNEATARIYRRILEQAGINAEFATTGHDALTIIGMEKPRLLVVDVGLPGMDGVELAKRARVAGYKGAIVAVSGYAAIAAKELAGADFVEVVGKPIRAPDLVALVHRWSK